MTPATILRGARADGVRLALSPAGTVKVTGDGAAVNRWLDTIRQHKAELVAELAAELAASEAPITSRYWRIHYADRDPVELSCCPEVTRAEILEAYPGAVAAEPFTPAIRPPGVPLARIEETEIRAWLARIGETDPEVIAEVLEKCQRDVDARSCFLARAAEPPADGTKQEPIQKGGE